MPIRLIETSPLTSTPTASLVADGGLRLPKTPKGATDNNNNDDATLSRMEALFTALRSVEEARSGGGGGGGSSSSSVGKVWTTELCNMLLNARLRAGRRSEAVALVEEMMVASVSASTAAMGTAAAAAPVAAVAAAATTTAALPPANALSVCLVLEALGRAGEWEACLRLLQGAKESLPAMDKAGLAMVYKVAIGACVRRCVALRFTSVLPHLLTDQIIYIYYIIMIHSIYIPFTSVLSHGRDR
jgi:pentatricopeptide repeat protein